MVHVWTQGFVNFEWTVDERDCATVASLDIDQFIQAEDRLTEIGERELLGLFLATRTVRVDLVRKKLDRHLPFEIVRLAAEC